jgi:hypothetical protein
MDTPWSISIAPQRPNVGRPFRSMASLGWSRSEIPQPDEEQMPDCQSDCWSFNSSLR